MATLPDGLVSRTAKPPVEGLRSHLTPLQLRSHHVTHSQQMMEEKSALTTTVVLYLCSVLSARFLVLKSELMHSLDMSAVFRCLNAFVCRC